MSHGHVAALTRFSLQRRITVLVTFLSVLVVGAVATLGIPLEMFPSGFTQQSLRVSVPWRDSPSREVLDKLTLPLEEELSTVRGVSHMTSYSRQGRANVSLVFKRGVDMGVAYREVRDRVERARALFPAGVDRVFINKDDISGIPIAFIGVAVDESVTDSYNLIKKYVVRPLERIDGVASIQADGLEEKEIIIEVDRQLAEGAGLNIYELAQDLGGDNFTMASGNVRDSDKKFLLRSVATYKNLEELENRLLRSDVRLKDVASVRYTEPERRWRVRVDSRPALALQIYKEGEANTVEVCRKIQATYDQMAADPRLADVKLEMLFSQGRVVEESIANLTSSGKMGGILAALVLFFFLRRIRLTLIVSMSIPFSLLIALTVMYFAGESLNLFTILALVIGVGLLVDNSVVVAENIYRLFNDGMDRFQACVQGAAQISLAIIMATLTTVIVFLPVALVDGQGQFFLMRMALPISVSLIASLFVALGFIPLCVYLTLPVKEHSKSSGWLRRSHQLMDRVLGGFYEGLFGRTNRHYNKALAYFLNHRLDLILVVFAVFVLTMGIAKDRVKFVEDQEADKSTVDFEVEMGPEYGEKETWAYFDEIEKILEAHKDEWGMSGYICFAYPGGGSFTGWLDTKLMKGRKAKDITLAMQKILPERAGVKLYTGNENENGEQETDENFVVRLRSEDPDRLEQVALQLEPLFLRVPGVVGVKRSGEEAPNEMALVVDRERATASGVNPNLIAGVVGYALSGSSLPRYNENGREIPVRIRYRKEDREKLADLTAFTVPTETGGYLPVSALTENRMLNSAKGIFRDNKQITRTITLELDPKKAEETSDELSAMQTRFDLPEGVSFGQADRDEEQDDLKSMLMAMGLSFCFIYLLMGFLFESFILPLSILITIPLAIVGVYWGHILMGLDMDFLGTVGVVLLIGVVVNNGIVLIDRIIELRDEGVSRTQAILQAADQRFNPIAMTALTTIIGMVPLAVQKPQIIAFGAGFSYKSFGVALIGGMTVATLLTLLVVPVLYTLFDDARIALEGVVQKVWFRKRQALLTAEALVELTDKPVN